MGKIKVIHIISGLSMGGAETMLYKLLQKLDLEKYSPAVISMRSDGYFGDKIRQLGIKVYPLNIGNIPRVKHIVYARKIVQDADVVQTWMYHADFFGYIVTRFNKKQKLIWGIRRSNLNKRENKKTTLAIAKINTYLSKYVDIVINCSIASKKSHVNYGFQEKNMKIIPNGFELDTLYHDKLGKGKIIKELNLQGKQIITNIGRWNIAKDHENLIKAYSRIENKNNHLLLVGREITNDNKELIKIITGNGVTNVTLLGPRSDVRNILSATNVYVSSSRSEGFPNVIGEAMACGVPCVVTNAGDSSYIVGDTGVTVPIENAIALAKGIESMLNISDDNRFKVGKLARKRIEDNFDIEVITKRFEALYE